jgi:uncharacterized phiE125 gp8 family phage protein
MKLIYTAISSTEPVTLAEAKTHLGEVWNDQDALITGLITAARERAEDATNRSLVDKTIELTLDGMPEAMYVRLYRGPLKAITSVKYMDADTGVMTEVDSDIYKLDDRIEPARLYFSETPNIKTGYNTLQITYTVGYGNITENNAVVKVNPFPVTIKQAILMMVRTMYDFRDDMVKGAVINLVHKSSEYLLSPYRIFEF